MQELPDPSDLSEAIDFAMGDDEIRRTPRADLDRLQRALARFPPRLHPKQTLNTRSPAASTIARRISKAIGVPMTEREIGIAAALIDQALIDERYAAYRSEYRRLERLALKTRKERLTRQKEI